MAETELRVISQADGLDVYDMLQSLPKDENGFMNGTGGKTYEEYKEWIKAKVAESLQEGIVDGYKVPQTTYWLYVDGKPVGMGKLRRFLTDALKVAGGHIGYAIAPQYRGKGYGKLILKLLLEEAKRIGLEEVLLTIHTDNAASLSVAKANGGQVEKEENGRYYVWISTDR